MSRAPLPNLQLCEKTSNTRFTKGFMHHKKRYHDNKEKYDQKVPLFPGHAWLVLEYVRESLLTTTIFVELWRDYANLLKPCRGRRMFGFKETNFPLMKTWLILLLHLEMLETFGLV